MKCTPCWYCKQKTIKTIEIDVNGLTYCLRHRDRWVVAVSNTAVCQSQHVGCAVFTTTNNVNIIDSFVRNKKTKLLVRALRLREFRHTHCQASCSALSSSTLVPKRNYKMTFLWTRQLTTMRILWRCCWMVVDDQRSQHRRVLHHTHFELRKH